MAWTHDQKLVRYEALMASATDGGERNAESMPKATTRKKSA